MEFLINTNLKEDTKDKQISKIFEFYRKLNKKWFEEDFTLEELKLDLVKIEHSFIFNSGKKVATQLTIKSFKTARSFYYYNPELFMGKQYTKLENNTYVNYKPTNFFERIPQIHEIGIRFYSENYTSAFNYFLETQIIDFEYRPICLAVTIFDDNRKLKNKKRIEHLLYKYAKNKHIVISYRIVYYTSKAFDSINSDINCYMNKRLTVNQLNSFYDEIEYTRVYGEEEIINREYLKEDLD